MEMETNKVLFIEGSRSRTRSGQDLHVEIKGVKFYKAEPLEHTKPQMLPKYCHLYQRFLTIKEESPKKVSGLWNTLVQTVVSEFIYDWVMMNVYTISHQAVTKKLDIILKFS